LRPYGGWDLQCCVRW